MAAELWKLIQELGKPDGSGGPVVQSDAPGTNERDVLREGSDYNRDVPRQSIAPKVAEPFRRARQSGPGPSGMLGYSDRGDPVRIATRKNEGATRGRFPELATHGSPVPHPPEFNILYDVFKTTEGYDKCILATAHNTWTIGTTTTQNVTLDTPGGSGVTPLSPLQLLNQYPGALQMLPVLLMFSFGQSVTTATGEYSIAFIPLGGDVAYPLGEYNAGVGTVYNTMRHIIKAPITDPGQLTLGQIIITSNSVVGTPSLFWRMGFGFALLLPAPAYKPGEAVLAGEWITAFSEPDAQRTPHMMETGPRR